MATEPVSDAAHSSLSSLFAQALVGENALPLLAAQSLDDAGRLRSLQAACLLPGILSQAVLPVSAPLAACARLTLQLRDHLQAYSATTVALQREYGWPRLRPFPTNDAFLLGDALAVAPVLDASAMQRHVVLPDGVWFDFWSDRLLPGGQQFYVAAPCERLPLFVRGGAVLPLWQPSPPSRLRVYPGEYETTLYEDSGQAGDYADGNFRWTYLSTRQQPDSLSLTRRVAGRYCPPHEGYRLEVFALPAPPAVVVVDRRNAPLWIYNAGRLELSVPDDFSEVEVTF